jgi:hypothetical protein
MYDKGKIIAGLVIFLGLLTFPFYSNIGRSVEKANPSLDTPLINKMKVKQCVRPAEEMKKEHMKILDEWRDEVVREGKRSKIKVGDIEVEKGLQIGCLQCHSNRMQFCDECHKFAGVKPYCWDCHFQMQREEGRI